MIPNRTIELLESITNYLDRRKDAQDGDYDFYVDPPPFPWALRPLTFPAPKIVDGGILEEEFYRWLSALRRVLKENEEFEEERLVQLTKYDDILQVALAPRHPPAAQDEDAEPGEDFDRRPMSKPDHLSTPIVYPDPTFRQCRRWFLNEDDLDERD